MKKGLFLTGIIGIALIFALAFMGCKNDAGGSDDGGGGGDGVGSITITGIKAALSGAEIAHNTVSGEHELDDDFTFNGGKWTGEKLDNGGRSTIDDGTVTIPVRGKGKESYGFKNGVYEVTLRVNGAKDAADNKEYVFNVTFQGSEGKPKGSNLGGLEPK
jgi:hypothetical protein